MFDYGNITEEHKAAILEAVAMAREDGNDELAERLLFKFKVKEPVIIPTDAFAFTKECEKVGIKVWTMGHVSQNVGQENSDTNPLIPQVSITEDVRLMDALVKSIRDSVQK